MATTVGQHSVAAFTSPSNGDALDATVVKGNDNTLRSAYVDHDADTGIHLQSSTLAARPAAGVAGRKWLTTDTGSITVWYDNGSTWEALAVDLSNLNASNLTSGTVPDARFPATLPAVSGANLTNLPAAAAGTLTGTTLASNVVTSSLTTVGTLGSLTVSGTSTLAAVEMADNTLTRPIIKDYAETYTTPAISAGTLTLDLTNGNVFRVSRNANITTLTISNPSPTSNACSFTLIFDANGTSYTITWPAAVKWPGGTAPTITTTNGRSDVFVFYTNNAGTTWYAMTSAQNLVTT